MLKQKKTELIRKLRVEVESKNEMKCQTMSYVSVEHK